MVQHNVQNMTSISRIATWCWVTSLFSGNVILFAVCFINCIWLSVISLWLAAFIYSGQLANRSRCGQWRWQLSCYCWPPRSNPSRCADEEVAGFWRCFAGTAGALCWCCLVGENSGPLQLSEEFKFVSDIKWYVWPLVQCVYFANDLRSSSYSCCFVFCGLWKSPLARIGLGQYLKPALFLVYMWRVQMNNICTRLLWPTCFKDQCIIQLSDSSEITKVSSGRCNGLLSKTFSCSSSDVCTWGWFFNHW